MLAGLWRGLEVGRTSNRALGTRVGGIRGETLLVESQRLRARALEVLREQQRLRRESSRLYLANDKARASDLAGQSHALTRMVDEYNREAAALCFKHYNTNLNRNIIDLHGLRCDEARFYLGEYMKVLVARDQRFFDVYVGKGNNSMGTPKLGQTLYDFCKALDVYCENVEPGRWMVNMSKGWGPQ